MHTSTCVLTLSFGFLLYTGRTNPTRRPTLPPTLDPTSGPTANPTAHPTSDPTASPTIDPCQISSESFSFFRSGAAALPPSSSSSASLAATPLAVEVPFLYEVETSQEYSPAQLNSFVLPRVEQALGDQLLPVLFDECAADGRVRQPSNPLSDGSIVGITTSPPDLAVAESVAECTVTPTRTRSSRSCAVVEGILTVYVPLDNSALASFGDAAEEREALLAEVVDGTQDAVRRTMDGGALDGGAAGESVTAVAYRRDGPLLDPVVALSAGGGGGEASASTGADGDLPIYIAIAGGAVAVGAVLLIVGAKMRNRQEEDKGIDDSDDSDSEYDENDVSAFHDNPTEVAERGGKSTYDMDPMIGEDQDWAAAGATAAILASA
jgi:hypothetical protein